MHLIILKSVVDAFQFHNRFLNRALHLLFYPLILPLSALIYRYDKAIGQLGYSQESAANVVALYSQGLRVEGLADVPRTGPLLVVANHAGLGDALVVQGTLPRTDVRTVVYHQGLLNGIPNFFSHCIAIDPEQPMLALREMMRCLKNNESVLLFPRGQIEKDPAIDLDMALSSLSDWSESVMLLARRVPHLVVVPVAVGGITSRRSLRNPLLRFYRDPEKRSFLAATFQMMLPFYNDLVVSAIYCEPLQGEQITMQAIEADMSRAFHKIHADQQHLLQGKSLSQQTDAEKTSI